ncbi:MAG: 2Fe-2S iron-sulfur cluster binding domain-containing protein [Kordiimonadaceae bacterium]|nr:2Fe-2S iron-sulfur cluster binding domain-containing protein [Kordiimonadaceae bacterium]
MPKIIFVEDGGTRHEVDADVGATLMVTATHNGVEAIVGACGGFQTCGSCHIYLSKDYWHLTGEPDEDEKQMIEWGMEIKEDSRLSCQIIVTEEMDGMIVRMPAEQCM